MRFHALTFAEARVRYMNGRGFHIASEGLGKH